MLSFIIREGQVAIFRLLDFAENGNNRIQIIFPKKIIIGKI